MATKPRSYRKGSYTYTESAPGSNKFQNFTASKPTVKKVRDESRDKKAKAAQPAPTISRNPYEKKADLPTISRNPYESSSKKAYPPRQGGMDTGNVMQKRYPSREMDPTPIKVRKPTPSKGYLREEAFGRMSVTEAGRVGKKRSFWEKLKAGGLMETFKKY